MVKDWIKIKWKYLKGLLIACKEKEDIELKKKKQAYVMLAANYNNLGDIAITKAQEEFLIKNLSDDYEVIVIPHDKTYQKYFAIKKYANEDTIITLIGGGNSGTLYEFIEEPRRFILKFFKDYKIISFPQSVIYESGNDVYQKEFSKLCKKCKKLTLIAREQKSYDAYRRLLDNRTEIKLTPDIVFSLKISNSSQERKGVSYIFRRDKEKSINEKEQKNLIQICNKYYVEHSFDDTCDTQISGNGYAELDNFISKMLTKELVITDRLHGMILAYVTNTPCIVLDNNNGKIKSTYETWLKRQNYIRLFDIKQNQSFEIQRLIDEIKGCNKFISDNLEDGFKILCKTIEEID